MTKPALTIWCNAQFPEAAAAGLIAGARPHRIVFSSQPASSNLVAGAPDPTLAEADIAFGQPDPQSVIAYEKLRWIHLTSAGYTRYDNAALRSALGARQAILSNSSQVFCHPCAEHALAMILANARQLPQCWQTQAGDHSWPAAPRRAASHLLRHQKVVLLGFGAIGRRLAELLAPFAVQITAVRTRSSAHPDPLLKIVTHHDLKPALGEADHVINLLPDNPETAGYVDAEFFRTMKPKAAFYNIGRGTTVDQQALLEALNSGHISSAYLDVTDPEPLPPQHPLWTAPNCWITPHTAGGHHQEPRELVRHFLENLARFVQGQPIHDRVI